VLFPPARNTVGLLLPEKLTFVVCVWFSAASAMSAEGQRVDDSPSTSGGSSDGDQREGVQPEQEREQVQPKKKEGKISSKTAAKLSTSAKRYGVPSVFFSPFLVFQLAIRCYVLVRYIHFLTVLL